MSRKIFLDAFYNQFSDFLDQLIKKFPSDTDLPTYKAGLFLLRKTNPMLVPTEVTNHVSPFYDVIKSRDEKFILDHQFPEYTNNDDALALIINKMKEYWGELSDTDKDAVWNYVILLLDLAKKCIGQ